MRRRFSKHLPNSIRGVPFRTNRILQKSLVHPALLAFSCKRFRSTKFAPLEKELAGETATPNPARQQAPACEFVLRTQIGCSETTVASCVMIQYADSVTHEIEISQSAKGRADSTSPWGTTNNMLSDHYRPPATQFRLWLVRAASDIQRYAYCSFVEFGLD